MLLKRKYARTTSRMKMTKEQMFDIKEKHTNDSVKEYSKLK